MKVFIILLALSLTSLKANADAIIIDQNDERVKSMTKIGVYIEERILYITGTSTQEKSYYASQLLIKNRDSIVAIRMNGPGGDFYAGLYLGRVISKQDILVQVTDECMSSCAMAAIASKQLFIDAVIGFHPPYLPSVPSVVTIDEITRHLGIAYLDAYSYMETYGWTMPAVKRMLKDSSPTCLLIVENKEELKAFKKGVGYTRRIGRCK